MVEWGVPMATIKEIAQLAKTSTATVSYVLSNKPARIGQKTRERILKIARELDYQPNALVHALRSKISYAIAVIAPSFSNSFFSGIISGIDSVVSEAGFQLMMCQHRCSPEKLHQEISVLRSRRVDGLIVAPSGLPDEEAYFSDLRQKGVNLVLIAQPQANMPYATFDELMGARMAVEHLHGLGHRHIGYVGPRAERLEFFCRALRERGLQVRENHLLTFEDEGPTSEQFHAFLQRTPRVTALIAEQDALFFPLYEYCRTSGFRIPEELSIVGHGNFRESAILSPPLTSLDQSPTEVGIEAGRIMLDLILKRIPQQTHQMTLKSRLIVRESTAGPFAGDYAAVKKVQSTARLSEVP